jgi:hypothetical protein
MQVHERLLRTVPAYEAARSDSETRAWRYANRMLTGARSGVTAIPVVVHVVYKTAAQNISDAQITSQIDVLNRDFRKTNPDVNSTPAVFMPLCGDARVEFELAKQDPQGNPTTGITRRQTTVTTFSDDDKVKSAATGGADAWPTDKYLNVWVCPLGGGLLGYAQFPGGPATTDGVVIVHSGFGTTGTAAAPFALGRSATHEIGHWLNLRHIWGDDGNGCSGDDFVVDTPNAAGSNFGAPAFPIVTCNNGPNGDLFMNYMDYVDDAAMFMFTNGQVTRMQACLDGDRASIGYTKASPTLTFVDLHPTLAIRDIHPTLAWFDNQPTLAWLDANPTLAIRDIHPTLAWLDAGPTIAIRDVHPTLAWFDNPPTLAIVDQGATLARIDQFKTPFLDKPPQADVAKLPGSDEVMLPGPIEVENPAPFILATPHHSMAWAGTYPELAGAAAGAGGASGPGGAGFAGADPELAAYEQALAGFAEAEQAGRLSAVDASAAEQLYAEYQRRIAERYG